MTTQCLSSDIISTLPQNIIETILTHMPIRDALRTSILSKKWRYCWMTMPTLVFDYDLVQEISVGGRLKKDKLVSVIFHVLLMHSGPTTLKFDFCVYQLRMVTEFDQIMLYLSRRINVRDLIIYISNTSYKLPTSFFSLQGIESLDLENCDFEPPVTFNGFSKLRMLSFNDVRVSAKALQQFLSICPLLEKIVLTQGEFEADYVKENSFTFVKLFQCVPLIYTLEISKCYMKYLAAGGMPNKLPSSLHLKCLRLDVCLREQDEISSALCMLRSSPNLETLLLLMYDDEKLPIRESSMKFVDLQDDLTLTLDHLKTFEMVSVSNIMCEMEFVKLIMAKSPVLKRARIELNHHVSVDEELKILRDMIYLPFPRASPYAKLVIERPKTSS